MRGDSPTRFGHDNREGTWLEFCPFAGFHDAVNDVVGVFGHGVVGTGIKGGFAAVIIHGKPTANVQVFHANAQLKQFGIRLGSFAHRNFNFANIGQLAANMTVQHDQTVQHFFLLEPLDHCQQFGGV